MPESGLQTAHSRTELAITKGSKFTVHRRTAMPLLTQSHLAMCTKFETGLVGGDAEHLAAVAALCWDAIDRVERMLSRFDPASEGHRITAEAAERPVRLSVELADVIEDCFQWWQQTHGY